MQPSSSTTPEPSALAPLARPVFRWMWIAALASNIGTWTHEVGAGWQMTLSTKDLALSQVAMLVAMVQFATSIPAFLLTMPAGALADVFDRRRIMLFCQSFAAVAAMGLSVAAWTGHVQPWMVLSATLCLGIGAALTNPAWQTAMVDLVPPRELPQASALNSVSLNLSRTIGPAIGGVLVASQGPAAAFTLNAVSFLGIIFVLWRWKYTRPERGGKSERFLGALKAGMRYIRHARPVHDVMVRTASYVLFASALWALMPLIARDELKAGATGYGWLLASLGLGAVVGAALLPRVRTLLGPNQILAAGSVVYGLMMAGLASLAYFEQLGESRIWVSLPMMFLAGGAWLSMVSVVNISAQTAGPNWVRGRVFACYLTVHFGTLALGSLIWGFVAGRIGIQTTLLIAAGGMILSLLTMLKYRIVSIPSEEHLTSDHWVAPHVEGEIDYDAGPVVITIEYDIRTEDAAAFRSIMQEVSITRYRDGAMTWLLTQNTENPRHWLEVFICESWGEHLRQHDRVTAADAKLQARARRYHQGSERPKASHWIAADVEQAHALTKAM